MANDATVFVRSGACRTNGAPHPPPPPPPPPPGSHGADGQFGQAKPRGVPHPVFSLAGSRVENYFAPQDRPATHVARWMSAARQRIHFMAFAFTLDALGDAALQRSRAGVEVGGVFEAGEARNNFSEFRRLKEAGLDVMLDGNPWNLHHKRYGT